MGGKKRGEMGGGRDGEETGEGKEQRRGVGGTKGEGRMGEANMTRENNLELRGEAHG